MFTGLPQGRPRGKYFGVSVAVQSLALLLLVHFGVLTPATLHIQKLRSIELVAPSAHNEPSPVPSKAPRLVARQMPPAPVMPQPRLRAPEMQTPPPIVHQVTHALPQVPQQVARMVPPAAPVHTGVFNTPAAAAPVVVASARPSVTGTFSTGSSATPTTNLPARKVQTGGFGDPNGVKPNPNASGSGRTVMAAVGSFDLPPGPGYGNGTGGARGARGVVASTGFGNGIARNDAPQARRQAAVTQASFADASKVAAPQQPQRSARASSPSSALPVEVLWKPKPTYTEEARKLGIEGEVVLEVVFTSSGHVQVSRVLRGLGHGLDEAAVKAASSIRFKPAQRDGAAIDAPATLMIMFQIS